MNRGFTLIELLVVVAIIGILAAIGVTNYLNAQIRARIARVVADFNSMATTIESYRIDESKYPVSDIWCTSDDALTHLTTPVSYISNLPRDVFNREDVLWWSQTRPPGRYCPDDKILIEGIYVFMSLGTHDTRCPGCFERDYKNFTGRKCNLDQAWQLRSLGPNEKDDIDIPYDPTNGLKSIGDIARFGPGGETLDM